METSLWSLLGVFAAGVEILGIFTAAHAVMGVRTAQGAIAWALSLVMFPYIALPLYWILSQNKFEGYVDARRTGDSEGSGSRNSRNWRAWAFPRSITTFAR